MRILHDKWDTDWGTLKTEVTFAREKMHKVAKRDKTGGWSHTSCLSYPEAEVSQPLRFHRAQHHGHT